MKPNEHEQPTLEVFINEIGHKTRHHEMTGRDIKNLGNVPDDYDLIKKSHGKDDEKIGDLDRVELYNHEQFHAVEPSRHHELEIFINEVPYRTHKHEMTGAELKHLWKVPANFDLFRRVECKDDEKIKDAARVHLHNHEHFYIAPKSLNPGGKS
jgi:hypothetical protein